ncbi:hypothetical protein ACHWQZ_G010253 [Mnemiopsis leidyi]
MMMRFKEKENIDPSMCSTPIVCKKTKQTKMERSFSRTPLAPMDINIKVRRSKPAEVEVLKTYIEDLHTSYNAQLKEQKEVLEESFKSKDSNHDTQLELDGLSEQTQIQILRKKLMKSNIDRDKHESSARNLKNALEMVREDREKVQAENEELKRELTVSRESHVCSGDSCVSKDSLLSERQNYEILSNSHKELEMQVCHLSSALERKNSKITEITEERRQIEDRLDDANKRCSMYENKIAGLEEDLSKLSSSSTDLQKLKRDFDELKLNKSKIRNEVEFLLDERETREITLEEIYKNLTETRKELAALRESDEELQEKYSSLLVKSETLAKQYSTSNELVKDTEEMCDFLRKKLIPLLPSLCHKHNVNYNEYQIQPSCPPLIGNVLYIIHAVEILEDLAGSVSINKETRKQISSLKDDKAMLESTISDLRSSLSDQNERVKTRDRQAKVLSETIVQYGQQIESSEYCLQELTKQLTESRKLNQKLSEDCERNHLQLERQKEDLNECREQLQLYDEVLHTVKTKMLSLGSSLPSTLKIVLKQLV